MKRDAGGAGRGVDGGVGGGGAAEREDRTNGGAPPEPPCTPYPTLCGCARCAAVAAQWRGAVPWIGVVTDETRGRDYIIIIIIIIIIGETQGRQRSGRVGSVEESVPMIFVCLLF